MIGTEDPKLLLYIEPKKEEKLSEAIEDRWTALWQIALDNSTSGVWWENGREFLENAGFRGFHTTECGESSTPHDYLLENGLVTNSLSVFYLKWYRNSIPESEWKKLRFLADYYDFTISDGE